jgi:ketosteroid isomerase-like protein
MPRSPANTIEQGATGERMARFFDPDVVLEEFPSRLTPQGARRRLADVLEGAERGQKVLSSQHYEIHNEMEMGDQVALEVMWTGTLKMPFQNLPPGSNLRARFALFLDFRGGRIVAQRNYDCFDPW